MAESKFQQVKQQLTTEYQTAIAQYAKYLATVQYLEKTGLKKCTSDNRNSKQTIICWINQLFRVGTIN
jgi:hypothetical protein